MSIQTKEGLKICAKWDTIIEVNVEGIWWNEFGSQMEIEMDRTDRKAFRGVYQSNIGNAQQQRYPLAGRCDDRGLPTKMRAFVVAWNADSPTEPDAPNPSVTAWCGQLQVVDGEMVKKSCPSIRCSANCRKKIQMKTIFVGNLNVGSTEDSIRSLFEGYGTVDRVNVVTDRDGGQARRFAFVEMANDDE